MDKNIEPCGCDTYWYSVHQLINCSSTIKQWLRDSESLTVRLKQHCQQLRVKVCFEGAGCLDSNELTLLGSQSKYYWIREVYLYGDNKPWVFGRSVMALETRLPQLLAIQKLAQKPLGELLFSSDGLVIGERCVGKFATTRSFIPEKGEGEHELWARRTQYEFERLPLVVTEVFLPDAPAYLED